MSLFFFSAGSFLERLSWISDMYKPEGFAVIQLQ